LEVISKNSFDDVKLRQQKVMHW